MTTSLRRSGRERVSLQPSLNESWLQQETLVAEREFIKQAKTDKKTDKKNQQQNGSMEVDDQEQEQEEDVDLEQKYADSESDDEKGGGEEEEEADETEKKANKQKSKKRGRKPKATDANGVAAASTPKRGRARGSSRPSAVVDESTTNTTTEPSTINARDTISPEEDNFSSLWHSVARSSTSIKSIVKDFVSQYMDRNTRVKQQARLALFNFLLESCGTIASLTLSELAAVLDPTHGDTQLRELIDRYSSEEYMLQLEAPIRRIKKFETRLREFFHHLYTDIDTEVLIADTFLHQTLLQFMAVLGQSQVRVFRLTTTVVFLGVMHGILTHCITKEKELAITQTQLHAAQQRGSNTSSNKAQINQYTQQITTIHSQLSALHGMIQTLMHSIFQHRYRDVDERIRAYCLEGLGQWMLHYPTYFLHDKYLKYVAWLLHDKAVSVRKSSISALLHLYQHASGLQLQALHAVTERFLTRLQEMCEDVDASISALAIELFTVILKVNSEILGKEQADHIPEMIWHEQLMVRKAAVNFVYADTFAAEGENVIQPTLAPITGDSAQAEKHQHDLLQLLALFQQYCPVLPKNHQRFKEQHQQKVANQNKTNEQQQKKKKGKAQAKEEEEGVEQNMESDPSRFYALHRQRLVTNHNRLALLRPKNYQHPIDLLVDGFYPLLSSLHDIHMIHRLIMANEDEGKDNTTGSKRGKGRSRKSGTSAATATAAGSLSDELHTYLLHVLISVGKKVHGAVPVGEKEKKEKSAEADARTKEASAFSTFLIDHLPTLLNTFQASPIKSTLLLQLFSFIHFDDYHSLRKHTAFTALCTALKSLTTKHTDEDVLRECGLCWKRLLKDNDSFVEEVTMLIEEIALTCRDALRNEWEQVEGDSQASQQVLADPTRLAEHFVEDEQTCTTLSIWMKRILYLFKPNNLAAISYSSPTLHHIYTALLPLYIEHHATLTQQSLLSSILQLCYSDLTWKLSTLNRSTPDARALSVLVLQRNELLGSLEKLMESEGTSFLIRDECYMLLSDCFVLFNGKFTAGVLHDLVVSRDRLFALQQHFNQYFQALIHGDNLDERMEESKARERARRLQTEAAIIAEEEDEADLSEEEQQERELAYRADMRISGLIAASHVVCFDMNSRVATGTTLRHPELTAMFLAQYALNDTETNAIIKHTMHILKTVSFNTLLMAQYHTLAYLYNQHQSEEELKALATRFALVHALQHPSFIPLLKAAISFACMRDPPSHLSFLDVILPFVQRANKQDAAAIRTYFQEAWKKAKEAAMEEEEKHDQPPRLKEDAGKWAACERFQAAIQKKIGKAAPIEAARPLESVTTGEGEWEATEELTAESRSSLVSPLATPIPRSRVSTSALSEPRLSLTPMSSTSVLRTPASRGSVRSGRSMVSAGLSPVVESEDEEEGTRGRRRQSSGKRARITETETQDGGEAEAADEATESDTEAADTEEQSSKRIKSSTGRPRERSRQQ